MRGSDGKQITQRLAAAFLGATSSFILFALAAFASTPAWPSPWTGRWGRSSPPVRAVVDAGQSAPIAPPSSN